MAKTPVAGGQGTLGGIFGDLGIEYERLVWLKVNLLNGKGEQCGGACSQVSALD